MPRLSPWASFMPDCPSGLPLTVASAIIWQSEICGLVRRLSSPHVCLVCMDVSATTSLPLQLAALAYMSEVRFHVGLCSWKQVEDDVWCAVVSLGCISCKTRASQKSFLVTVFDPALTAVYRMCEFTTVDQWYSRVFQYLTVLRRMVWCDNNWSDLSTPPINIFYLSMAIGLGVETCSFLPVSRLKIFQGTLCSEWQGYAVYITLTTWLSFQQTYTMSELFGQ